ncbi:hypothetical protein KI387_029350, partial [Taxus chinensis]
LSASSGLPLAWIETSGLGDVVGALPKTLSQRGHKVMVIIPQYNDYIEERDARVHRSYNVVGRDMEAALTEKPKNKVTGMI